nr:MAG TPA: hypothetical protein [Caudoviricetes sp.]
MPRKGRPQRVTGTFPEALKQGRTAMPYQVTCVPCLVRGEPDTQDVYALRGRVKSAM